WLASTLEVCTWSCPPLTPLPIGPPDDENSIDPSGKCRATCSTNSNLAKQSCLDQVKHDAPYCFAPSCQSACEGYFQLASGSGEFTPVYAYGHPNDLEHNLTRAYTGEGALIVENIYDINPVSPNFNKVIQQRWGTGWVGLDFHDLVLEEATGMYPQP